MEVVIMGLIYMIRENLSFDRKIRHVGWKSTVRIYLRLYVHTYITLRFTVRNITVNNAQTGVFSIWNWGRLRSSLK